MLVNCDFWTLEHIHHGVIVSGQYVFREITVCDCGSVVVHVATT